MKSRPKEPAPRDRDSARARCRRARPASEQMPVDGHEAPPLEPPAEVPDIQRGNWLTLPASDPVVRHVADTLWGRPEPPTSWATARLSQAAYIYREEVTRWALVAKFYAAKTGSSAQKHAARELRCLQRAKATGVDTPDFRVVRPLGLWRGVLFLEYLHGLRLEDVIAVRQSQPGRLTASLDHAAQFLARLHTQSAQSDADPNFDPAVEYAHGVVEQLAEYGVLQQDPIARDGVDRLIDRWAAQPLMRSFTPTLIHGDATTTNFILSEDAKVVVVDWERLDRGDPASDLGRLMAEITHSVNQHGGSVVEAQPFVAHMVGAYCSALPVSWDREALVDRARFYRASSTLRIARNGWVSRLDRTALVAQAMALLAAEP